MPEIRDVLDLSRFDEILRDANLGTNLWASLELAAQRGDASNCRALCRQISVLTKATFALVKTLGDEEPNA